MRVRSVTAEFCEQPPAIQTSTSMWARTARFHHWIQILRCPVFNATALQRWPLQPGRKYACNVLEFEVGRVTRPLSRPGHDALPIGAGPCRRPLPQALRRRDLPLLQDPPSLGYKPTTSAYHRPRSGIFPALPTAIPTSEWEFHPDAAGPQLHAAGLRLLGRRNVCVLRPAAGRPCDHRVPRAAAIPASLLWMMISDADGPSRRAHRDSIQDQSRSSMLAAKNCAKPI